MLKKHELVVIARAKGWKGSESRQSREYFVQWLDNKGVPESERADIARRFRTGQVGGNGEVRQAEKGITQQEVMQLIENALPATQGVDEELLKKLVNEAVQHAQPAKIVINESIKSQVAILEGTHPLFEKVLKLVVAGVNVLLVGPAGCGKTTLAHQLAKALKRKYGSLHCSAGASESQLLGWLLPVGEGKKGGEFTYVPSEFVRLYEEGNSVFLLDEIDAADPNMLLVINSALANGALHVPQRHTNPHVKRGNKAAIIAAANTYGSGADIVYAGRNQLDAATLDRFYVVEMDYDKALEQRLGTKEVCEWAWNLREKVKQSRLRRVISTRVIMKVSAAVAAGVELKEAQCDALAGWTRDELSKAGVA
jgi:cobaltochelatase CobS